MSLRACAALAMGLGLSARADVLDAIKPGEWYEAPGTRMDAVKPSPLPAGNNGFRAVMESWSGGAYDAKRDRLLVWGGGHSDYSGNELYAFDIATLKWSRLTEPSADVGGVESSGAYPDGNPRSRHTYNYLFYAPGIDRFCSMGGAGLYPSGQTGDPRIRCFDFGAGKWEDRGEARTSSIGTQADWDPASGLVWSLQGGGGSRFASWDPATGAWSQGGDLGWTDYYATAAIGLGHFVSVGGGKAYQFDLAAPKTNPLPLKTTGDTAMVAAQDPGFAFSPKADLFVAWSGGKEVYVLDLAKRAWLKAATAPGNAATPTPAQSRGTYGRFRYIPSRDLFIAVNSVDENVYFYRLPADLHGSGTRRAIAPGRGRSKGRGGFRFFDLLSRSIGNEDDTRAAGLYLAVPRPESSHP